MDCNRGFKTPVAYEMVSRDKANGTYVQEWRISSISYIILDHV